jgi:cytoskeletal protein RodZ
MATPKSGSTPRQPVHLCTLNLPGLRHKKGVSLEQIADTTKISLRFLRAIEAEEFEKLPGGIFNTSYLKQYAAAIGFDAVELLAQYNRKVGPVNAESVQPGTENRTLIDRWLRMPLASRL